MGEQSQHHREFTLERLYPNCKEHVWAVSIRAVTRARDARAMLNVPMMKGERVQAAC